jgi:uncharacterized protein YlxW (UPF0749 family)
MRHLIAALIFATIATAALAGGKLVMGGERLNALKAQREATAIEEARMTELTKELDAEQAERDLLALVADLQKRVKDLEARVAKLEGKTEVRQ